MHLSPNFFSCLKWSIIEGITESFTQVTLFHSSPFPPLLIGFINYHSYNFYSLVLEIEEFDCQCTYFVFNHLNVGRSFISERN